MTHAKEETKFIDTYASAKNFLNSTRNINNKSLEELDHFFRERNMFAQYCLDQMKGSRARHGSAPSEMNHSSVLVFLNDRDKHANAYIEEPYTLLKYLFKR